MDIELNYLRTDQGFKIIGENTGDLSGSSVSGAGDVNGDGYADVIIGAPQPYPSTGTGISYVIFGKAGGLSDIFLSTLSTAQGFKIYGESSGDMSGSSVSGAGDVNGDGYADVIIGAPYASDLSGKSYVIFGKASGFSDINLYTLTPEQGFRIFGELNRDYFGCSVSGAGDVNKDGYADVIIGAHESSVGTGKSYIIFGKASGFTDIELRTLMTTQGFRIFGENRDDNSGFSVSSAGDVNGDGYADVIIGAPVNIGAPGPHDSSGKSYVIFGKASGFSDIDLYTLTPEQGFRILGEGKGDYSGYSVSGAGDVNKDGYADVIIGGSYGGVEYPAGKSYVIFGKDSGFSDISLSALNATQGFRIIGERSSDQSGYSVSGAGDINKDGYADVIIGAPQTYPSTRAGKFNVIYGGPTGSITQGFRILGESYGDGCGYAASSAGDVNGDGYADLIIGACIGKSYVIFAMNPLEVTAMRRTITYGSALPALTKSYSGFVNFEGPSNLTIQPILATTATANSSVGHYTVSVFGGVSSHYYFIYYNGFLTIDKALLTVTAKDAVMTYGGKIPVLTESYSGFVKLEGPSNLLTQPSVSTNATSTSRSGAYTIKVSGGLSSNYDFKYINGVLTINKAPLKVVADNATMFYESDLPAFIISYHGFVNSEGPANLIIEPIATTTATVASLPGVYPIEVSRGLSSNYDFIYKKGYLTIHEASTTSSSSDYFIKIGIPILGVFSLGAIGCIAYSRYRSKLEHSLINEGVNSVSYVPLAAAPFLPTSSAESIGEGSEDDMLDSNYEGAIKLQISEGVLSTADF